MLCTSAAADAAGLSPPRRMRCARRASAALRGSSNALAVPRAVPDGRPPRLRGTQRRRLADVCFPALRRAFRPALTHFAAAAQQTCLPAALARAEAPCAAPPRLAPARSARRHALPPLPALPARSDGPSDQKEANLSPGAARLLLLAVPVCWGTYNPSLRFLYSQPHAPSPGELSAARLAIAVLPYLPTLFALIAGAAAQRDAERGGAPRGTGDTTDWLAVTGASLELGGFNFVGTAFQAWGLAHTSAVHAGVLLSSINVLVPLGAALSGDKLRPVTWAACAMVLAGIAVLNSGAGVAALASGESALELALSPGDAAVLAAALSYSAYTVRLGAYAKRMPALPLSAGKTAVLALGCLAWATAELAGGWAEPSAAASGAFLFPAPGEALLDAPAAAAARAATWAAVTYSALVPGAFATWLQARGQSGVSAPEAQVILALTPVVSIIIAGAVLGEEVGPNVWEGGAIMLSASLLCVAADVARDRKRAPEAP